MRRFLTVLLRHVNGRDVWGVFEGAGEDKPVEGEEIEPVVLDGYLSRDALVRDVKAVRKLLRSGVYLEQEE